MPVFADRLTDAEVLVANASSQLKWPNKVTGPDISASCNEAHLWYDKRPSISASISMALGKLFKSLLGGALGDGQPEPTEPVDYKGFGIEAAPINEDGKYRTSGFISGEINGEVKRVQFIRADQNSDLQAAIDHSLAKARQIIDEQGAGLLEKTHL
jgi:hypothetical protein